MHQSMIDINPTPFHPYINRLHIYRLNFFQVFEHYPFSMAMIPAARISVEVVDDSEQCQIPPTYVTFDAN